MISAQVNVLGLGGSTRQGSWSDALLRKALAAARDIGMRPMLFPVRRHPLPVFDDSMLIEPPPAAVELLTRARRADAVILCTPVYHGTVSGAVKNALDHLEALAGDDPPWLSGRCVGLMAVGYNSGTGGNAINALDHACRALRATTVPTVVTAPRGLLDKDGAFDDPVLEERVRRMVGELAAHAGRRAVEPVTGS